MPDYSKLFFPATNSLNEINMSMLFFAMILIVAISVIYIISSIRHLKLILKNRDNSLRQNGYIIFKFVAILFLSYVIYEIAKMIMEIS